MKTNLIVLLSLLLSLNTFAGPVCTTEDKSKWQDQTKFQNDLKEQGYEIKIFKLTKGNCYEIYGKNKESKKVEIYFNPVTGKAIKTKIQ